jgi:serine/threonine-protein kinase HipA
MSREILERLGSVVQADVYKGGKLAGGLHRLPDAIEFQYRLEYLREPGPPVATTLPLSEEPVRTPAGAVPPFFAGLLPEGRRLSNLRRAVKTSADDELSLILGVGHDTIGDVQVVPQGEAPSAAETLLQVQKDWKEVRFASILADAGVVDPVGIPGIQDKTSALMISVPVARARGRYILKVDPPEYPYLVQNEAFFLSLARRVGLNSVEAAIVRDQDDIPGLLIRRFDRVVSTDGVVTSLACEDACQVLARWPADKYNVSCEEAVIALADRCPARLVALRSLYQQVCFAWLTGNGDVHAKNLSILATPEGEWRVAPAYDLPSTVPYGDLSLALSIGSRTRGLSRKRLFAFAEDIGLPGSVGAKILDELLEKLSGLEEEIRGGALPFSANVTRDFAAEIRYRRRLAEG